MRQPSSFLRQQSARVLAVALLVSFYAFARPPAASHEERASLARNFSFRKSALPETAGRQKTVREVHPSLRHMASWVSSVGASVALNDLDGDGLPNDLCHVDPRTDQVSIAPVPGTPERYQPFVLTPAPDLPYDARTTAPMGCLPGDFNEDGAADVLVYYWGRSPVAFIRRHAGGEAPPRPQASAFAPREVAAGQERWYTNAATQADVDGDGHTDIIVGNYFQDGARILDAGAGGREQMQHSMSRALNGGRNRLLLWAGAGGGDAEPFVRYADASRALDEEAARGWTLAVAAADLDGDLLPEIYFANDFGADRLLHNRSRPGAPAFALLEGERSLTTPRSKVLGRDSFKGMGVDFADFNGDGLLDIFVSNIAEEYALEESHFLFVNTGAAADMRRGVAPFVDRSETLGLSRSGWGWDAKLADFNNDGAPEALQATGFVRGEVNRWPELHELAMGNDQLTSNPGSWFRLTPGDGLSYRGHNPFYVRAADGRFYDVATEIGLGAPQITRGLAVADTDGDGRLDFATANQWEASHFFRNESPRPGAFLGLHLRLPAAGEQQASTRLYSGLPVKPTRVWAAVGATATVRLPGGRVLAAQVDGGNGHSGRRSPDLHFGLGDVPPDAELEVEVKWRDASGAVRQKSLRLTPGWWTAILGE
jgi:enediyne biosynthesis protein E4